MFQNSSTEPISLKKGQVMGRATMGNIGLIYKTSIELDWADLVQPGSRKRSPGITAPRNISPRFYSSPVSGDRQCLADELDFLAAIVLYVEHETEMPSEQLCFTADGREVQGPPRSITEDKPWKKIASAQRWQVGEKGDPEVKDEIPAFPTIHDLKPGEGEPESITRTDVRMAKDLSREQQDELFALLMAHIDIFSKGNRLGQIKAYNATINAGPNDLPPAQHPHPAGPEKGEVIEKTIDQLLAWDVIEPSVSKTASPIVLVWQNNKCRFCVDFRQLNSVIIGDAYPMLRSDYVFSTLAGKRFFSLLDAVKGYHQVEIEEKERERTAFISHKGLYQYKRLPFGLKNAPAQFQPLMDQVIRGLRWQAALVYIDDLLIYSNNWTDHICHLRTMIEAARSAAIVFSLEKCSFAFTDVKLLGHRLSRYSLHTLSEKVTSITSLAPPKTMGELHRLLEMFGYCKWVVWEVLSKGELLPHEVILRGYY